MAQVRSWVGLDVHAAGGLGEFCVALPGPTLVACEAGADHRLRKDCSGQTRRQGQITKSGSRHGRRLLVEAAWHYRRRPATGTSLARRQAGQSPHVLDLLARPATPAPHLAAPDTEHGKRRTLVAVAVARELAGFCWAIANTD